MTHYEFEHLNIGDEVIYTNGSSVCAYIVSGKEAAQGNILYEVDGDIFYVPYDKLETKSMCNKMKSIKRKTSITLGELKEKIDEALAENPSWTDKMVYVDHLSICGTIEENGSSLELF